MCITCDRLSMPIRKWYRHWNKEHKGVTDVTDWVSLRESTLAMNKRPHIEGEFYLAYSATFPDGVPEADAAEEEVVVVVPPQGGGGREELRLKEFDMLRLSDDEEHIHCNVCQKTVRIDSLYQHIFQGAKHEAPPGKVTKEEWRSWASQLDYYESRKSGGQPT